MKQYKIGEVFEDTVNFPEPKILKCVKDLGGDIICKQCVYVGKMACASILCSPSDRFDSSYIHIIETDEPLTTYHAD